MKMLVSGIFGKDGHKVAYVMFEEGKRFAEAEIPKCKIIENHGFSEALPMDRSPLQKFLQQWFRLNYTFLLW